MIQNEHDLVNIVSKLSHNIDVTEKLSSSHNTSKNSIEVCLWNTAHPSNIHAYKMCGKIWLTTQMLSFLKLYVIHVLRLVRMLVWLNDP